MRKKPYSAAFVNQVDIAGLVRGRQGQNADLGLDIGKETIFAVIRWDNGEKEMPWKAKNPSELETLVALVKQLAQGRRLRIGMEPTGTYGDPLRQKFADAGLEVQRVSSKASHDYSEILDNVPSQHDGKDAVVVAELVAIGKSRLWKFEVGDESKAEMKYWVDEMEQSLKGLQRSASEMEGELARHWPELGQELKLTSATLLRIVKEYGDPQTLSEDVKAAERIKCWSFGTLSAERIARIISSAKSSMGVRTNAWSLRRLRECAERGFESRKRMQLGRKNLERIARATPHLQAHAEIVGGATACVLEVYLGEAKKYSSGQAYRKAMGLNLVERSSGKYQGQLRISKRGQPSTRRWLYFAALRWSRREPVKSWFASKKLAGVGKGRGTLAAVAVMRKLALGLYEVSVHGVAFDASRLFSAKSKLEKKRGRRGRRSRQRRRVS